MIILFFDLLDDEQDKHRFEDIYNKYKNLSGYICFEILKDYSLAEDAVSEVFFKLARNFKSFQYINEEKTRNYIRILSRRMAINMLRKMKNDPILYGDEIEIKDDYIFEEHVVGEAMSKSMLLNLPEKYYEVLYMSVSLNLTGEQIAQSLDININTVYKRLQRAREILRKKYEEK